ncbi:uncharacterized protein LOC122935876 isoform X3 [Bufo gargarizans]|uniref:uncharacterized protein LOC122935876 isoform X3 n=1 Tax=Bufo gargarizans TaxID=30331 RepID=UPI001CF5848C|nr:uncharacterized protein LOC122935876 isoform X3 [Bufo gargarizans]
MSPSSVFPGLSRGEAPREPSGISRRRRQRSHSPSVPFSGLDINSHLATARSLLAKSLSPNTARAYQTGSDSSRRNPPKRCPRPLYPQDCREEKLPENHQAEVKDEEEEETDLWGDQQGSDSREVPPRDVPVLCIPRTVQRRSSQRTIRIHPRFIRWRPDTKWIPISHMCNRSG